MTTLVTAPAPPAAPPAGGSAEPDVRGGALLAALDRPLRRVEASLARLLPRELDPLAQAGAVANVCLLIAIATGILLLFWYVPSVHQAHASMRAIEQAPWTAGLIRSLHRYSSDACMLFVLLHAVQIVLRRRFTGARWLAWVTGLSSLAILWGIGWLGYWLVWDQPAQQVALGTAKLLDELPIFIDPLSRSFVADATVNSLLFFVVFFAHMLLPVLLAVGLWLHVARLARARFLTGRALAAWITLSLLLVSLAWPAAAGEPAQMAVQPERITIDAWYLAPLALTSRLSGSALWLLLLVPGAVLLALPRWSRRTRIRPAVVDGGRCNACRQCTLDCPYEAVRMVPRTADRRHAEQAQVDPSRCIGCGICVGSCDSTGIGLPWLPVVDLRRQVDAWLAEEPGTAIVFACAHSAGGGLQVEPRSGRCAELPRARVLQVPCAGWVHMLTVERALRRGAGEVVVVGCPEHGCRYREGMQWTQARLDGTRAPSLREQKADRARVRLLAAGPGERRRLLAEIGGGPARQPARRARRLLLGLALATGLAFAAAAIGNLPYTLPGSREPELVLSFKHAGRLEGRSREVPPEELAKLPVHMRQPQIVERSRSPVRLRVRVDGVEIHLRAYAPSGIWQDGNSIGLHRFRLAPGRHRVEVQLGETTDPDEWTHATAADVESVEGRRAVLTFDRDEGFVWR
jgi:coenzyme F420-reducing hydrogenase delta subunit/Pyruvate/2-oxoacid:ferredoxin oxidoreductase delta subunit